MYGAFGYYQWTPDTEMKPRGIDMETGKPIGEEEPPPIMDLTVKMNEGKQFFVNRITFTGNHTTHDAVIRRELRVAEGAVFNGEALKGSIRRLNQLGYFKPLEGNENEMEVKPTPDTEDRVDITLKVQEQNRNQLAFGAGMSQFEGVFGQLSYQTSNFLGRGETASIYLQKGALAAAVPARLQRAVPLRPTDHARLRRPQHAVRLSEYVHAAVHRRQHGARIAGEQLHARVPRLQL